jgi:hypothetical protein
MEYPDQLRQPARLEPGRSSPLKDLLDEAAARDPSDEQPIDRVLADLCPTGAGHELARAARRLLADGLLPMPGMVYRTVRLLAEASPLTAGDVSKPLSVTQPPLAGLRGQSVGRDAERTQAVHELTRRPSGVSLVCITGPSGVGKTRLASEIMQAAGQAGFAPRLRISLGPARRLRECEDPALPVYDALLDLLIALGIQPLDVPETLEGRQARYRAMLKDRRPLIVLDGVVDGDQVLPLLPPAQGAVMVISRRPLSGLSGWRPADLPLTPLDRDAARLLVQRCFRAAGHEPSEAVIMAIRDWGGGMPVPIMAVSRWMITTATQEQVPFEVLVERFRSVRQAAETGAGSSNGEDPAVITMKVLFIMLRPEQQLVIHVFGTMPVIEADIPTICLSTGLSQDQVRGALAGLAELGWVARRPHNGFVMDGNIAAYDGTTGLVGAAGEVSPGEALVGLVRQAELSLRELRKLMTAPEIKARAAVRDWVDDLMYEQWRAERELAAVLLDTAAGAADPRSAHGLASVFMDITELAEPKSAPDGWRETQRYITPVLQIARAANDPKLEARALQRFGGDELRQEAAGRAAELFSRALDCAQRADEEQLSREIEAALGRAVSQAGRELKPSGPPPPPDGSTDPVPEDGLKKIGAAVTSGGPEAPGRPMLFGSHRARTW